jgi:GGDEF domain-containing protein
MLLSVVGVYKIIERINLLYVDARSQSLKDELTQLPNRRFFIDTIREKEGQAGADDSGYRLLQEN